jgi:hypothetical protein
MVLLGDVSERLGAKGGWSCVRMKTNEKIETSVSNQKSLSKLKNPKNIQERKKKKNGLVLG